MTTRDEHIEALVAAAKDAAHLLHVASDIGRNFWDHGPAGDVSRRLCEALRGIEGAAEEDAPKPLRLKWGTIESGIQNAVTANGQLQAGGLDDAVCLKVLYPNDLVDLRVIPLGEVDRRLPTDELRRQAEALYFAHVEAQP